MKQKRLDANHERDKSEGSMKKTRQKPILQQKTQEKYAKMVRTRK